MLSDLLPAFGIFSAALITIEKTLGRSKHNLASGFSSLVII
jgi:hypothetical protein